MALSLALAAGALVDFLELDRSVLGDRLPAGWSIRPVKGHPAPSFSIDELEGERVLRIRGSGAAAWAHNELEEPIAPMPGVLRWSWRVLQAPAGADLRSRRTDDSAIRVYVVFGKPGGLFGGKGRVIFYTWGNAEPDGLTLESFISDKIRIVRVAGASEAGEQWRAQEADPFGDYERFWQREPPPITGVGVMQDTDMTRSEAVAELRALYWEPEGNPKSFERTPTEQS